MRNAVCQFIEGYATFKKQQGEKMSDGLEKFEAYVFSGIAPTDEKVLSTFDGFDQLSKLLKGLKQ